MSSWTPKLQFFALIVEIHRTIVIKTRYILQLQRLCVCVCVFILHCELLVKLHLVLWSGSEGQSWHGNHYPSP